VPAFLGKIQSNAEFKTSLTLKEVYLPVPAPDNGSVYVVRNSCEAFRDLLGVIAVHLLTNIPPVLGALEEVCLTVPIRKSRVDLAWEALPALGDESRVSGCDAFLCQLPVVVTCRQQQLLALMP